MMGCFDFEIVFRPGRQSSKPDALSRRPDLKPPREDKLTFGQLLKPENITPETFAEVAAFESWFQDESIDMEDPDHWFEIDVLGIEPAGGPQTPPIASDVEILTHIRALTPTDPRLHKLRETMGTAKAEKVSEADGVIYNNGQVEVPDNQGLKLDILQSRHDSKLEGHPGQAKTLALVWRCFTWPAKRRFIHGYIDGCNLCQRVKTSTQRPYGSLEPLPIPAGPWTNISYDMITDLPISNGFDSILTVIDRLTKMCHFIPCSKTLNAKELADLLLNNVWKIHGTPKTIVSDWGSIFVLRITKELSQRLGIRLQPSAAYHPRTDGQSEIANKAVEQYLRHYVQYRQSNWAALLPSAEFAYNNNRHKSLGMSPFRDNFGFDPTLAGIPSSKQCVPA
jgi:hypothetical protein